MGTIPRVMTPPSGSHNQVLRLSGEKTGAPAARVSSFGTGCRLPCDMYRNLAVEAMTLEAWRTLEANADEAGHDPAADEDAGPGRIA